RKIIDLIVGLLRYRANGIRGYTGKVYQIPGEWNSRLHSKVYQIPGEWNSRLCSKVYQIPGEWNSRLHRQSPPSWTKEIYTD
ncbi:MAG: hypothetical protein ACYTXY_34925, partial [Nostoc sp.]